MEIRELGLGGMLLLSREPHADERGTFEVVWNGAELAAAGIEAEFVQDNLIRTRRGTLRGMHFQTAPHGEDKLIRCLRGAIVDIIIDLRPDSPTYKKFEAFELDDVNKRQLLVPKGFGHGFQTVSDHVEVTYLVTAKYTPSAEGGVRWNDPAFGIKWPLAPTDMSDKDRNWPDFKG